jgi:two-component system, NtrC family, nitrogen regulation response regulator GlnG
VELPPLRDRAEDVPELVDFFLAELGKPASHMSPAVRARLCDYAWPGNVRELRNVVTRVVSLGGAAVLSPTETGAPLRRARPELEPEPEPMFKEAKEQLVDAFEKDYLERLLRRFKGNVTHASAAAGITRVYLQKLMKKHGLREE